MKKKLLSLALCVILAFGVMPSVAVGDTTYDPNEYQQLKTFLDHPSASDPSISNGLAMSELYLENDPGNWPGVTWELEPDDVYHVTDIDWKGIFSAHGLDGDLDLSGFTYLRSFMVNANSIDSLKVDGDTALTALECSATCIPGENAGITTLDLRTNTALETLDCHANALTSLDLSKNTALYYLDCSANALTSLVLGANTTLYHLDCCANALTSLDVRENRNLKTLFCNGNMLSDLNVTANGILLCLNCNDNQLTELDVGSNSDLDMLYCNGNKLKELDLSNNDQLGYLHCSGNQLEELDLTDKTMLSALGCSDNQLEELDLTKNEALNSLDCSGNRLETLDLTLNTNINSLDCGGNQLKTLHLPEVSPTWTGLMMLDCSGNLLETLDVEDMIMIVFDCTGNPLTHVQAAIPSLGAPDELANVELSAAGKGYVGLHFDLFEGMIYAKAAPKAGYAFANWTNASGAKVSAAAQYDITPASDFILTANFTSLAAGTEDTPAFTNCTLTDGATGVTLTGSLHRPVQFTISPLAPHPSDPACDAIRRAQAAGQLIIGFNASLTSAANGPLTLSVPVGSQYDGKTVTILLCANGELKSIDAIVADGKVAFTVTELSPFAVISGTPIPGATVINPPNTGDAASLWGFVAIGLAVCADYVVMRRRRA